jgi:hypothetical protein
MFSITKFHWMNLVSNGLNMSGLVYEFVSKHELGMMIECAKLDGFNDWPMFATLTSCPLVAYDQIFDEWHHACP